MGLTLTVGHGLPVNVHRGLNAGVLVAADEGATMAEWSGPGREWRVAASGAAVAPNDGNAQKPSL